jgi:galactose-1-phosphate uridylyltransferase
MEMLLALLGILVAAVGVLFGRLKNEMGKTREALESRERALAELDHTLRMTKTLDKAKQVTEQRIQQVENEVEEGRRDHFESNK